MKIFNEDQLVDPGYLKAVIEEIEGPENQARKQESYKRWEVLKDRVKKYIIENLLMEMDETTVREMQSRASSINLFKKVVAKKARVYKTRPDRMVEMEANDEIFIQLQDLINLDSCMKKANRYLEAFRNCLIYIRPYMCYDQARATDGSPMWKYELRVLPPHMYDVIEDEQNPERARAYILSDYSPRNVSLEPYNNRRGTSSSHNSFRDGDNVNQRIADSPADRDKPEKKYIFWSTKYHFTCSEKGQIMSEDLENPIRMMPMVDLAKDRDGEYWSLGGEDLIEGSLLTNTLLTDYNFIQKIQGMGIFYLFGKNIPKQYKVGPNRAISIKVEDGDPTPQIGFASANPNLAELREGIAAQVALLLTTNDLGINSVAASLDGSNLNSALQEMVQHSEPLNAIEDDQQIFMDNESKVVDTITAWHNYFLDKGLLHSDLAELGKLPEIKYSLSFPMPEQYTPEATKLQNDKIRKELGIADEVTILAEHKGITEDEAEAEILRIQMRKNAKMASMMINNMGEESQDDDEDMDADDAQNEDE